MWDKIARVLYITNMMAESYSANWPYPIILFYRIQWKKTSESYWGVQERCNIQLLLEINRKTRWNILLIIETVICWFSRFHTAKPSQCCKFYNILWHQAALHIYIYHWHWADYSRHRHYAAFQFHIQSSISQCLSDQMEIPLQIKAWAN